MFCESKKTHCRVEYRTDPIFIVVVDELYVPNCHTMEDYFG